jgi:hydrogenase maturation protease
VRALVIGYGNIDRGDDGAAFHVVNRLRSDFGQRPLAGDEDGWSPEPDGDTALFAPRLLPELALDAAGCRVLVLVDAHVSAERRPVVCARVLPEYRPPAFTHQISPSMFVWLAGTVGGGPFPAFIVSLRGRCFGMQRSLSAATAGLVDPAAEAVLRLVRPRRFQAADVTCQGMTVSRELTLDPLRAAAPGGCSLRTAFHI